MPSPVVTSFVDAAIAQLRRLDLMRWPGKLPEPMRDASIPSSKDWVGWKPISSTVTDADLDALERETGLAFPPLYRDFLQDRHFVSLTETGVRFERHCARTRGRQRHRRQDERHARGRGRLGSAPTVVGLQRPQRDQSVSEVQRRSDAARRHRGRHVRRRPA